ncbi:MAG TPA: hypothetical protein VLE02_01890 [Nitrosarchaeum sp.]|nr:hypothetical protein [Nitrosarchaeum sp.]
MKDRKVRSILSEYNLSDKNIDKFLKCIKSNTVDEIYDKIYYVISRDDHAQAIKTIIGKNILDVLPVKQEQTFEEVMRELDIEPIKSDKYPCRNKKCENKFCITYTLQKRRADEAPTVYVICPECNGQYKIG